MAAVRRTLRVSFADAQAFEAEYAANLRNGGVFVASDEPFEPREQVRVELLLEWCAQSVVLGGEVVHVLTPDMAQMGALPGVAVQFEGAVSAVRGQLEPLRLAAGVADESKRESGARRSPRTVARVAAEIDGEAGQVAGVTRDLSQNGVLVSVSGEGLPVGESIRVALRHPHTAERMEVDGVVVRREESDDVMSAVAIEFAPPESESGELSDFVSSVQAAEHTRRLGGIVGDIAELGIQNVMQMFVATGREGTLTLRHGELEGVLGFQQGLLKFCRVGPVAGMKALVRLLGWESGTFEFHSSLDPVQAVGAPLPFEAALLEALTLLDEGAHAEAVAFALDVEPRLVSELSEADLSKTEAAVIDLVRAGFSVRRMIAVIPEPDPEIQRALASLHEQGVIDV
ncbi:MAG: PilZ domain-containing protein [Deltaproteobacteria bacterium]|nr:PilZ domain-containing protein [Deltaproteobacteria bacterium]